MIVTIDGPSGTGKSTVAKLLAKKLCFSFFDTGAMYRASVWWIHHHQIDIENVSDLAEKFSQFHLEIQEKEGLKHYLVEGVDITEEIRQKKITEEVSKISALKEVREALLPLQREYAFSHDCVFEGRDLGTVVFPKADVKIFLTANPEVRAERRYKELMVKNPRTLLSKEEVLVSLEKRDAQDMNREIAPLKCPEDAFVLDTSFYEIDQVVDLLLTHVLTKKKL